MVTFDFDSVILPTRYDEQHLFFFPMLLFWFNFHAKWIIIIIIVIRSSKVNKLSYKDDHRISKKNFFVYSELGEDEKII